MATAFGAKIPRRVGAPKRPAGGASRAPQRHQHFFLLSILGAGLVSLALLHVWLRLQVVHMGYALSASAKLQNQLEQENRELRVEIATVTSPERLATLARGRLGLGRPQKGQIIVLP